MKTEARTEFNEHEIWDEDPTVYGWVLGIEGEILLGVGRTKREAYQDAIANQCEPTLLKRGGDAYFFRCTKHHYDQADADGDGYMGNAFSMFEER
jgi:hypothetical protein